MEEEADDARHRDAAVLDLSVAEEGERLVTAHRRETIRVEDLAAGLRANAHPARGSAVHRLRALALPRLQCVVLSAPSLVSASPKPISAAKATHMDSTPICALSCCSLGAWTATLLGAKPETPPTIIIMSAKFRVRVSAGQTPDYVRLCQPTGAIVPASGRRGGGGGGGDLEICNFMGELWEC